MKAHLDSDGPAFGAESPPGKKEAAPAKVAACSGEHNQPATPAAKPQESGLTAFCKAYMRCGPTDRRLFLQDVKAAAPNLWREVDGGPR